MAESVIRYKSPAAHVADSATTANAINFGNCFTVQEKVLENQTLGAGGQTVYTIGIGVSGWTVVGLVGFFLNNAISGGTNVSNCFVRTAEAGVGASTATVSVKNTASSQAKIRVGVRVLYRKS